MAVDISKAGALVLDPPPLPDVSEALKEEEDGEKFTLPTFQDAPTPEELTAVQPEREAGHLSIQDLTNIDETPEPPADPNEWKGKSTPEMVDMAVLSRKVGKGTATAEEKKRFTDHGIAMRAGDNLTGVGWGYGMEDSAIFGWLANPKVGAYLVSHAHHQFDTLDGLLDLIGLKNETQVKNMDWEYDHMAQLLDHPVYGAAATAGMVGGYITDPIFALVPGVKAAFGAGKFGVKSAVKAQEGITKELNRMITKRYDRWLAQGKLAITGDKTGKATWMMTGGTAGALAYSSKEDGRFYRALEGAGAGLLAYGAFHGAFSAAKAGVRAGQKLYDKLRPSKHMQSQQPASDLKMKIAPRPGESPYDARVRTEDAAYDMLKEQHKGFVTEDDALVAIAKHFDGDPYDYSALANPRVAKDHIDNLRLVNQTHFEPWASKGAAIALQPQKRLKMMSDLGIPFHRYGRHFVDDNHLTAVHATMQQMNQSLQHRASQMYNLLANKEKPSNQMSYQFLKSYIQHMRGVNNITGRKADKAFEVADKWFKRIDKIYEAPRPINPKSGQPAALLDSEQQLISEVFMKLSGGQNKLQKIASALALAPDTSTFVNTMMKWHRRGNKDAKFRQYLLSNMLWNPPSQLANIAGNGTLNAGLVGEKFLAAGVSSFRRGAHALRPGKSATKFNRDYTYWREAIGEFRGSVEGSKNGFMRMSRVLLGKEDISQEATKFFGEMRDVQLGPLMKIDTLPLRALFAMDEGFKELRRAQVARGMAEREHIKLRKAPTPEYTDVEKQMLKKMSAQERHQFKAERKKNIQDNIPSVEEITADIRRGEGQYLSKHELMEIRAQEATFTRPLQIDRAPAKIARHIQRIANDHIAAKLIFPFVQAPFNIMGEAAKRIPLLARAGAWYGDEILREGAARTNDMQLGREMAAGLLGASIIGMVQDGEIIGAGPPDPIRMGQMMDAGYRPYSFNLQDNEVGGPLESWQFSKLEPMGWTVGMFATAGELYEHMKEGEWAQIATHMRHAMASLLTDKTYVANMNSLFKASNTGDWTHLLSPIATAFVPMGGLVGALDRVQDPIKRLHHPDARWRDNPNVQMVEKLFSMVKDRMLMGEELVPDANNFGEILKKGGGIMEDGGYTIDKENQTVKEVWEFNAGNFDDWKEAWSRMFNTFSPREINRDPSKEFILNAGWLEKAITPHINIPNKGAGMSNQVPLSPWQLLMVKLDAGATFRHFVDSFLEKNASFTTLADTGWFDRLDVASSSYPGRMGEFLTDMLGTDKEGALATFTEGDGVQTRIVLSKDNKKVLMLSTNGQRLVLPANTPIKDIPRTKMLEVLEKVWGKAVKAAKFKLLAQEVASGDLTLIKANQQMVMAKIQDLKENTFKKEPNQSTYFSDQSDKFVPKVIRDQR